MSGSKRSVAAGLGLTAAALLANAPSAQAAMEIAQVADGDGRVGILGFIFLPALAWVAFNIAGVLWVSGVCVEWVGGMGAWACTWRVMAWAIHHHAHPHYTQLQRRTSWTTCKSKGSGSMI